MKKIQTVGGWMACVLLALPVAVSAASVVAPGGGYELVGQLMSENRKDRRAAARILVDSGDETLIPGLVDAVFFVPRQHRAEIIDVLRRLSGEKRTSYHDWLEYVGSREDLTPRDGYFEWKVSLFERIDHRYGQILYLGAPLKIRLEEVVWGGVKIAGIPALVNPAVLPASEVGYLRDDEQVFGVELGGVARAYPLRILDWHEMLNDVVGGEPVALSYCTLCGSGILYSTQTPSGKPYSMGTSGLLYRSNKLMFDAETLTLWSNLTGRPVVGRLANSPVELEVLPMTRTSWGEWRRLHPDTEALDLDWVEEKMGGYGFDYRPGAADRARSGVAFPVWQRNDRLDRNAEIYALEVNGAPKAYPLDRLASSPVVNDVLGGEPLVVVSDRESGAVRVYRRGERSFRAGERPDELLDDNGGRWRLTEGALVAQGGAEERLECLPGHVAFWFGWYGFYPRTEIWQED